MQVFCVVGEIQDIQALFSFSFFFFSPEAADHMLGCWIREAGLFYSHESPDHTKLSDLKVKKKKRSSVVHNF